MRRLGSCEFEEVAEELALAADAWMSALDVAAFDGFDRFEPAQGCFG